MLFDQSLLDEIAKLGEVVSGYEKIGRLPTGSLMLDAALNGGWPKGTYSTISGQEGVGKTTLCMLTALSVKRSGGRVAFIMTEGGGFDVELAYESGLGEPKKDYLLLYPRSEESALQQARLLIDADTDLIVLDSIAGLTPNAELQGKMSDQQMMLRSRLLSKFFYMTSNIIALKNTVFLMINQVRDNTKPANPYSPKYIYPGGKAKDHYPRVAIVMDKPDFTYPKVSKDGKSVEDKGGDPTSMFLNGRMKKNTYGPNRSFSVQIRHKPYLSVNTASEIVDLAQEYGILHKRDGTKIVNAGATWYFGEEELGAGRDATINSIQQDLDLKDELESLVREAITNKGINNV